MSARWCIFYAFWPAAAAIAAATRGDLMVSFWAALTAVLWCLLAAEKADAARLRRRSGGAILQHFKVDLGPGESPADAAARVAAAVRQMQKPGSR